MLLSGGSQPFSASPSRQVGDNYFWQLWHCHPRIRIIPERAIEEIGWALEAAQFGGRHPAAKPWKGVGPRVLDIELVRKRLAAAEVDYEARYGQEQK